MSDWNWFFSSLAQCNAAIVGFLGGFTINKILNKENEFSILIHEMNDIFIKIKDQLRHIDNRYIIWLNNKKRERTISSDKFKNLILNEKEKIDYKSVLYNLDFSEFDSLSEIKSIIESTVNSHKENKTNTSQNMSSSLIYNLFLNETLETKIKINEELNKEFDLIKTELINTRKLSDEVQSLYNQTDVFPKEINSIQTVLLIILLLYYIGVIIPLIFTPILCFEISMFNIIKVLILLASTIVFLITISIFFEKVSILNFKKVDISELIKYCDYTNYSEYFKNYDDWEKYFEKEKKSE